MHESAENAAFRKHLREREYKKNDDDEAKYYSFLRSERERSQREFVSSWKSCLMYSVYHFWFLW